MTRQFTEDYEDEPLPFDDRSPVGGARTTPLPPPPPLPEWWTDEFSQLLPLHEWRARAGDLTRAQALKAAAKERRRLRKLAESAP